ncbi:complement factor I [Anguilla anguilla]|uniref:complement factor I n=1 Tax=Anguilla anguilla TaxID=7936 RepID=UPI0015AAA267|nr:complement factor I [Anguilla anguilla]
MEAVAYYYLFIALLIGSGVAESPPDEDSPQRGEVSTANVSIVATVTAPAVATVITAPAVATDPPAPEDPFLSSGHCLKERFTQLSCQKAFCPPWMRCIGGTCTCKLPYMCHKGAPVCSNNKRSYVSFCQVKAVECLRQTTAFSHLGHDCKGDSFETILREGDVVAVQVPQNGTVLVCGEGWDVLAANVVCRHKKNQRMGAEEATTLQYGQIRSLAEDWPGECVSMQCTGLEGSLAECTLGPRRQLEEDSMVATATCYEHTRVCSRSEFTCVNGKCIALTSTCDSLNDCGDNSDEMCCRGCRSGYHCKTDVCIPQDAKMDGIVDCLGGEDEIIDTEQKEKVLSPIKREIKIAREKVETLVCGISNKTLALPSPSKPHRRKRVVGGEEAGRTQFPWQVAIQESGSIDCGGIYISSCWVLTAAHCVRPKPEAYQVKFSLWSKLTKQDSTDLALVEKVIIHPQYNPTTYQNDIALLQLEKLPFTTKCLHDNPAIGPACVPWSEYQFLPGDKCTISGWGRQGDDQKTVSLRWATIEIMGNCSGIYGSRYFPGMECAGSLDGSVDTCQGDSGGPLVCEDIRGVAYAWGIVSWGDKCGIAGHPGVYTKVAHYFEWISSHIGKSTISRYNV